MNNKTQPPNLTPKEAGVVIQFLNRVDLKGSESEALAFVKSKLIAIREGPEMHGGKDDE